MEEETEEGPDYSRKQLMQSYPRGHSESTVYFQWAKDIQMGLTYPWGSWGFSLRLVGIQNRQLYLFMNID